MGNDGKPIELRVSSIAVQVDGHWLWNYARDFLSASRTFQAPENRFSPVRYYLICHSIELSLKAFLFTVGYGRRKRRSLNHDLVVALRTAEQKGLADHIDITAEERESIQTANDLYTGKEFEYYESLETVYDQHGFDLQVLAALAGRLVDSIEAPVKKSATSWKPIADTP